MVGRVLFHRGQELFKAGEGTSQWARDLYSRQGIFTAAEGSS